MAQTKTFTFLGEEIKITLDKNGKGEFKYKGETFMISKDYFGNWVMRVELSRNAVEYYGHGKQLRSAGKQLEKTLMQDFKVLAKVLGYELHE